MWKQHWAFSLWSAIAFKSFHAEECISVLSIYSNVKEEQEHWDINYNDRFMQLRQKVSLRAVKKRNGENQLQLASNWKKETFTSICLWFSQHIVSVETDKWMNEWIVGQDSNFKDSILKELYNLCLNNLPQIWLNSQMIWFHSFQGGLVRLQSYTHIQSYIQAQKYDLE